MSVLATDNFDRADANPIGGNWTTVTNWVALKIVSNVLAASVGNTDNGAYYNAVSWPNDQYSKITLSTSGTNDGGPMVRLSSSTNTGYLYNNNDGSSHLYKLVAGAFTELGTGQSGWTTNDVAYVEAQVSTLVTKLNGTTKHNLTDSAIASGSAGMTIFNGSIRFDTWEGGDFGSDYLPPSDSLYVHRRS